MKTKITFIAILLACGFLTVAASADQSVRFSLSDVSRIGTAELKPGDYKLVIDDAPKVVLTHLKSGKTIELQAKVEDMEEKFERTEVHSSRVDGVSQIKEIRIGGSKTKIAFD